MHCVIDFLIQLKSQIIPDGQADVFLLERDVALTVATGLNKPEVNVVILSVVRIQINGSTVVRLDVL